MSEEQPSGSGPDSAQDSGEAVTRRGPPPNPLYHPLFLPVLMVGFSLWFFWDGYITTDPEMLEHETFNRVFFGVTQLVSLRFVPRGIREFLEERDAADREQTEGRIP